MAVPVEVDADGAFRPGTPQPLFDITSGDYEPAPDGSRFLFVEDVEDAHVPPATVVLSWPALLREND